MRISGTAAEPRVTVRLNPEAHPQLRSAIENISEAAGLPPEVIREHLDHSVLRALEILGDSYVQEMGAAVERLGRLRETVHSYYERALVEPLDAAGTSHLREALVRLRDTTRELVAPDVWAKRRRRAVRPATEPEPVTTAPEPVTTEPAQVRDPIEGVHDFDAEARRPAGTPATRPPAGDPAAPPRWAAGREERRLAELPEHVRKGFLRARGLRRAVVDAALRGEPGAALTMLDQLKGVLTREELAQTWEAVGMVRSPDMAYALGGGLRGSRPPAAHVQAAYHALPAPEQAAVGRAISANPEFVRAMLGAEELHGTPGAGTPWRPEEMERFCAENGIGPEQRADLERALTKLNAGHRTGRVETEAGIGGTPDARSRAALLDEQAARLGLPSTGRVAEALRGSAILRDLGTRNPDQLLELADAWLRNAAKRAAGKQKPIPLDVYVRDVIMGTHTRGMLGELGAVFQMAEDVWVLKAPGTDVTVGGTDFIVVVKATGEIWFCDNKTLSRAGLGEVSSLVENLGKNMTADVAALSEAVRGLTPEMLTPGELSPVELPAVLAAVERLRTAAPEVGGVVEGLSGKAIAKPAVQAGVNAILERPDIRIRRVITNAGGELTYLQRRLTDMEIELADLRSADFGSGMRPLGDTVRPAGGSPPAAGGRTGTSGGGDTP